MSNSPMKRADEAARRQEAYDRLTPQQKLRRLIDAGHGHCKQAQRLRDTIEASQQRSPDSKPGKRRRQKPPHKSNKKGRR